MQNKRLIIVVSLMLIALIGLISIQARWLQQAYELREQEFDRVVQDCLNDLVEGLEVEKIQGEILDQIVLSHSDNENEVNVELTHDEKPGHQQVVIRVSNDSSRKQKRQLVKVEHFDTIFEVRTDSARARVEVISQLEDNLKGRKELIDKAANRLFIQMLDEPGELLEFDLEKLSRKLDSNLKANGLEVDFKLVQGEKNPVKEIKTGAYVRPVSWLEMNAQQPYFMVEVHNKKAFLRNSWLGSLLLSMFLTLLLVYVFYDTISTILKQKRLSAMKNDFINNMTHEFKTPLATVNLALDAMAMPGISENEEKRSHYLGLIRSENKKMHSQVERVLDAARFNHGDLILDKKTISVDDLLRAQLEKYDLSLKNAGIQVKVNSVKNAHVLADEFHLGNAIGNLIDNSIKYGNSQLILDVTLNDNCVFIAVQDDGIGMSKEVQEHVFEQFYRKPTGNIHNVKGFGLGLSYVKAVVDAHAGEIKLRSKPNQGSTFTIKLCRYEN